MKKLTKAQKYNLATDIRMEHLLNRAGLPGRGKSAILKKKKWAKWAKKKGLTLKSIKLAELPPDMQKFVEWHEYYHKLFTTEPWVTPRSAKDIKQVK